MPKDCVHFWKIVTATESTSPGICTYCEEVRIFNNSSFAENWNDKTSRGESQDVVQGRRNYLRDNTPRKEMA